MAAGRKNIYLTAVVLGSVLVCAAVLALRWHALAGREDGAGAVVADNSAGMALSTAVHPGGKSRKSARAPAQAAAGDSENPRADSRQSSADPQDGMSTEQLRRQAEARRDAKAEAGSDADSSSAGARDLSGSKSSRKASGTGSSTTKSAAATPAFPLELNRASRVELEAVPGIGPVLAGRILDYRKAKGAFRTVDELDSVKGIGPKTLAELREYFYIEPR